MKGKNKKKEIFLDLTALLDVILIMLFWVMMNTSQKAEDEREKASAVQTQLKTAQEELEKANKEAEQQKEKARDINKDAAANQEALDEYAKGGGVVVNIKNENGSDVMHFLKNEEKITQTEMENDVQESLLKALELMEYKSDDVILCTITYDGNSILDRNFDRLSDAVENISDKYKHLYCTFIDISGG